MKWFTDWLGKLSKKSSGKGAEVFSPLPGRIPTTKVNPLHGGGMDANVVPKTGLEWMDEKDQK